MSGEEFEFEEIHSGGFGEAGVGVRPVGRVRRTPVSSYVYSVIRRVEKGHVKSNQVFQIRGERRESFVRICPNNNDHTYWQQPNVMTRKNNNTSDDFLRAKAMAVIKLFF
ncbi:hypothetical protein GWI33_002439 [Rhynchophorus ferrugineus]|uniref:Uncharacterized protein n=1 Tax=Rhynchophorus ferrugineus TaxID=354439 RepID=A0A834ITZ3_RHYFE|nr:hypothetical protein GWI33_002439 [Rhynchophorus ferrugineus]